MKEIHKKYLDLMFCILFGVVSVYAAHTYFQDLVEQTMYENGRMQSKEQIKEMGQRISWMDGTDTTEEEDAEIWD